MNELVKAITLASFGALGTELVWPPPGETTRDRMLAAARRVERVTGWKHFDCFVDRVAWRESRYNARAGAYWEKNAARGLFQVRPRTARAGGDLGWIPLWSPPEMQVALAADLVNRAVRKQGARDWLDVKAWWAYPSLATATAEERPRRDKVEKGWLELGERFPCPGIDAERLENYAWPGGAAILAAALGGTNV